MFRYLRWISMALVASFLPAVAPAQIEDPIPGPIPQSTISIQLDQITGALSSPNWATDAGDGSGRLFVVDQPGQVYIIENGMLLPDPLLDVSPGNPDSVPSIVNLNTGFDERGLLGLAFHPEFSNPAADGFRKFYTYTSEPEGRAADYPLPAPGGINHQSAIREWSVDPSDPNRVDPASVRELLRVDEPQFNHNAGAIAFGPDDLLYIAFGDGGAADDQGGGHVAGGNGQDLSSVLGSIIRIDVAGDDFPAEADRNYAVPADNPFVGQAGAAEEIFAYGFRNPFRFSFDRTTGDLVVGDVGQNDIEEVDIVTSGGNFGWPVKEGTFLFDMNGTDSGFVTGDSPGSPAGLTDPVLQYDHDEGIAVIGGFVYRGSALPDLQGKYLFGELAGPTGFGRLFAGDLDAGTFEELIPAGAGLDGLVLKGFGQDEDGELYVLASDITGPFGQGFLFRVVPEPSSVALLLLAAGLLSATAWRRANRSAPPTAA
jgi:glucose/arabinose dehydrogenase